jgi:hypothetical protein
VTVTNAPVIAISRAVSICGLAVHRTVSTRDLPGSTGNRSGEKGGKESRRAPRLAIACWIPTALCARRWSITTICPGADTMQGVSPLMTYPSSLFHNPAVAQPPQQGSFTRVSYESMMRSLHGHELPLL